MRCIAYALIGLCSVATAQAGTVVVTMEGAESANGVLNAALCDKGLSEEGCPIAQHRAAATGRSSSGSGTSSPTGTRWSDSTT
jgi:hypothetical protein